MRDGDIRRLIAPRSIALIGATAWTDAVAAGNAALGFQGTIWRVHPSKPSSPGRTFYRSVAELPGVPDAAFIAVPNLEAPAVAGALAARGAGGFVCFSSGFSELGTDLGRQLTRDLLDNAAGLPFFGPNCYGFVNFFDRAAMLPDQVVGTPIESGVAMICQSGTIALTLSFNDRSVPIGYLFSVGNQTRLSVEDLIEILSDDPRVTAFGLYLEGIKDAERFARAADKARAAGKPIAVIKSGRTAAAARTAHSHTGALAGADSVFDAFCRQAGLARCDTLGALCETLKLFHAGGAVSGRKVLIMGASGGDMAMTADVARNLDLDFAEVPPAAAAQLQGLLTDRVTVANPLDIHTYLWFDPPALGRVFSTAMRAGYDAVGFMLDFPPEGKADASSFDAAIAAYIEAARGAPARVALIASLPETLSERVRRYCLAGGIVPLQGQREALEALAAAGAVGIAWRAGSGVELRVPPPAAEIDAEARSLSEADGKAALAAFGVVVPRSRLVPVPQAAASAESLGFPVVIKAVGEHLEHKTEVGGVVLNVRSVDEAEAAARRLGSLSDSLLVEEMIADGVAEVLVGLIVDRQFGQVLVLGSGGVLTELLADSVTLLPPFTRSSIESALGTLKLGRLLRGYRGKPPGDIPALIDTILGVTRYAAAHLATLREIDVNPVIVRPAGKGAVAVDALIRLKNIAQILAQT
ncbi:MAG TPA: acetate--CoA ligase family protein [Steroidobacteraceae bacterium]|jgi:acetyl-CoA synthetase|nr:acetate--CoA ligase family protein [Steroidobacteraceae bacterium]